MQQEIKSQGWTWFIRAWIMVPILIWIPLMVAYAFYEDRQPVSQPWFWVSSISLDMLFHCHVSRRFINNRFTTPSWINLALVGLVALMYAMPPFVRWTKGGPYEMPANLTPSLYLIMMVSIAPYLLFGLKKQTKLEKAKIAP